MVILGFLMNSFRIGTAKVHFFSYAANFYSLFLHKKAFTSSFQLSVTAIGDLTRQIKEGVKAGISQNRQNAIPSLNPRLLIPLMS